MSAAKAEPKKTSKASADDIMAKLVSLEIEVKDLVAKVTGAESFEVKCNALADRLHEIDIHMAEQLANYAASMAKCLTEVQLVLGKVGGVPEKREASARAPKGAPADAGATPPEFKNVTAFFSSLWPEQARRDQFIAENPKLQEHVTKGKKKPEDIAAKAAYRFLEDGAKAALKKELAERKKGAKVEAKGKEKKAPKAAEPAEPANAPPEPADDLEDALGEDDGDDLADADAEAEEDPLEDVA